jgi:hypothetical protein
MYAVGNKVYHHPPFLLIGLYSIVCKCKLINFNQYNLRVLGVGLTTPPCKTWIWLKTSTEASEEEEGWGGHGLKMGQSTIEQ